MKILIVDKGRIPVSHYGGTQRVIWYLGKELVKMGHEVSFLVGKGSQCSFARVLPLNPDISIKEQIPADIDLIHFNFTPEASDTPEQPFLITNHGNRNDFREFDKNTVFVSRNHAERYGSESYVYNGLDWEDYGLPLLNNTRQYFHFLGKAAWRLKNVQGAIDLIKKTKREKLYVMGGNRINISMGFRITLSRRVKFFGMVGGKEKLDLLNNSKALIFPVLWHEPFGLAIIESLYFGCPVLGTPYGSLPELLPENVGFLSNSRAEMLDAIENIEKFSGEECHLWARDNFNSEKMALAYLQKYRQILDGETLNSRPPVLIQKPEPLLEWKD